MHRIIPLALSSLLLSSCVTNSEYQLFQSEKNTTQLQTAKPSARSIEYHILPQDRLDVMLYKDPDQNSPVALSELGQSVRKDGILVNKNGFISLPLIGKVKVSGLSQTQAADLITRRYRTYINTPSVYLEVLNKRLFVLGEVKKPGVVKIDKEKMTLLEALAFAGDITDAAVRDNIAILSADQNGTLHMRKVDLTHFDSMKYSELMLRPNDIVYVRPNSWKAFRVASDEFTSIFNTVGKIAAPFVSIKYLSDK